MSWSRLRLLPRFCLLILRPRSCNLITDLGAAAVGGAEPLASGVCAAADVRGGHHTDTEDTVAAMTRLVDLEHAADSAERRHRAYFAGFRGRNNAFHPRELARALERSKDGLAVAGNLVHVHVMADLSILGDTYMVEVIRIGDAPIQSPHAEHIGAKAANLARMAAIGVLVLPRLFCRSSFARTL